MTLAKESAATDLSPSLFLCQPEEWLLRYPKWMRLSVGYLTMFLFSSSFLLFPAAILAVLYFHACGHFSISVGILLTLSFSFILPAQEWIAFRKIGQLWYELLQLSTNLSPEMRSKFINEGDSKQFILAMHPHGLIPFHAILYASFCEQYLSAGNKTLYGFGAAANVVLYLPFLRNIMGWLSVSACDYGSLRKKLLNVRSRSPSSFCSPNLISYFALLL